MKSNPTTPFSLILPTQTRGLSTSFKNGLDRRNIQSLHSTHGIQAADPYSPCTVVPPKESRDLTDQFLYYIQDCSINLWGQELRFDYYVARELLTQEDKLPKALTKDTEEKLDIQQSIENKTPANHLKTHLERIIDHALNYADTENQIQAINAIYDAAKSGKKIIFVSAHGVSCEREWGLDLFNVPHLLPTSEVLSEISRKHANEAALIYINSCNPDNLPIEEERIALPVIAHTDRNSPSYSPVTLHLGS